MWAFLTGILPALLTAGITAYTKSKDVTIKAYEVSVGIATAQAEYMKEVLGHPLSPPSLLCYSVFLYYGKAIAYDNVISFWFTGHAGYTPPLTTSTASVAGIIVSGMFFSGIASIIKRS